MRIGATIAKKNFARTEEITEKAIIVGVEQPHMEWNIEDTLDELERLVQTDGGEVVARETQRLTRPVPKTYIGTGKAEQISNLACELGATVVVFDDELTPSQQSNLERLMGEDIKVIDRTALILDIFGRHARTSEGRLQVQLAQNQYLLPRLRGMWSHLVKEQTRGGIGSRFGQGESQLEVDRRIVRNRISALKHDLAELEKRRGVQSKARWDAGIYRVALVGYTNAGKSTLLNTLTGATVYVQDELFATLDPTTRTIDLEEGRKITLTDTVGFIQKLPTMLIEAFKSTLSEVLAADLILLVVDAGDANASRELETVRQILSDIGAQDIPSVTVYNKTDLLDKEDLSALRLIDPDSVCISALKAEGINTLRYRIAREASRGSQTITVVLPYSKGILVRLVHERCQVLHEEYTQDGLMATVRANKEMAMTLQPYTITEHKEQALSKDAAQEE